MSALFVVGGAIDDLGLELGLAQRWQEHGGENRNDGDYDQQLN